MFSSHPILNLEEPLIYLDGKFFTGGPEKTKRGDYLKYRDKQFKLDLIGSPNFFDLLYCKRNNVGFEEYKQNFIQSVKQVELHSKDDILNEISDDKLVKLIVGRVLPKLTGEKMDSDLDKLLGSRSDDGEVDDSVEEGIAEEMIEGLEIQNPMVDNNI
ncbi:hypothetical protein ACFL1H_06630, partial [Nanoarchaeota archaeon]